MTDVIKMLAATVSNTPDKSAVTCGDDSLSYSELEARSNQLARHLQRMGVKPGTLVGICMERGTDMMVGLLGTMKAGGAYVPLDPAYPAERIAYMLDHSAAPVVITQGELSASLPQGDAQALCLDEQWPAIATEDTSALAVEQDQEDLAYVIYTSGSTGRPKGVEIPHRALGNFLQSMGDEPGIGPDDRLLAVTTLSFDIAGLELYLPLVKGAQVVIASRSMAADGAQLMAEISARKISVMQATPATWRLLLEAGWPGDPELRVFCGGEALSRDLAEQLLPRCRELWNLYGPTETTIWSTVSRVDSGTGPVSIGHAILNTQVLILDDKLQPVPEGAAGELYIGGDGLARGYHKSPDLTRERFIPHPDNTRDRERLYRTGDLARVSSDGTLDHLGRVDFQVKVRGFRIELGEIEAVLESQATVRQAVVIAREDSPGEKRLVAYVIPQVQPPASSRELRNALAVSLPDYMVPGYFLNMESFPLTPNGKVDRKAFPAPDSDRPELANDYLAPSTAEEEKLSAIWAEVLRLDKVGVNDNFFELGGDSLKVAQVATRIRDVFGVDMALRKLFENPTVGSLAPIISGEQPAAKFQELPITSVQRSDPIPPAFAQERVWFIQQLKPDNLAYNFIARVDLTGKLDAAALERALGEILRRHESYRTSFPTVDGRPVQVVHPFEGYALPVIDLRGKPADQQQSEFKAWTEEEYQLRFDLAQLPLVRWHLVLFGEEQSALMHMEHHLVHDGWSFNVFLVELVKLYTAYSAGKESPLEELPIQFAEFATWQRQWMQGPVSDHQLEYWKKRFTTIPPVLELPHKGSRPSLQSFRGSSKRPEIPIELCNKLRTMAREEGSTLFMTMLAGFIGLLHRYTGETDVAVGTFFANRRARESEGLIGMILNNTVIRTALDANPSARDLVGMVRDTVLDAAHYQDVPFDRVVEAVQPRRDMSANPLFQVMFSFHDEPMPEEVIPGIEVRVTPVISNGSAKFDLGVIGIPHSAQVVGLPQGAESDGLTMIWEYSTDLFEGATITRMIEHYICLLEDMVKSPEKALSDLTICTPQERETSLVSWNDTATPYSSDQRLHQLVQAQVEKIPDNVAVVFGDTQLTYRELDEQSNKLANLLRERVGGNDLVGICLERSEKLLIGLLGILKAGGTYVPMDPNFPADRLSFMVEDAGIKTILTEGDVCDCLESDSVALIRLDREAETVAAQSGQLSHAPSTGPDDLAYVIYTSGSTGRPKGVEISHRALVNFLETMAREPGIRASDRLFAVTTISFDIAGLELYLPLIRGARVIVGSRSTAIDGEDLGRQLASTGATLLQATPTTWQLLIDCGWEGNRNLTALCGGEALPRALAEQLLPRLKCLWNMYGPTETTIWSTIHKVRSASGTIPIGRPIGNTRVFILDRHDQPAPIGVAGELCIGGDGLAQGYLHRPELTAEKFIANPLDPESGELIYRTGDLARYKGDGTIECLGRTDHQIKLRGYRIELGEIESLLDRIEGISQSVVVAREDQPGIKRLVAYIVSTHDCSLTPNTILARLREDLPDYMVPSACVVLEELPLTPNNKVDRLALPPPGELQQEESSNYVAARSGLEKQLVAIWEETMGVSPVGVQDDFFDVGGHSILAVRLVTEIESRTGKKLPVAALLQGRTIEYVASALSDAKLDAQSSLITLQQGGSRAPLFMIGSHPRYADIPRQLGSDQPVYQIDMYATLTQRKQQGLKPFKSIGQYADHFIEEIRKIKQKGPYSLGGGCEGAYLAYELAVRLQEQGEEIGCLAMWIPPPLRESKGLSMRRFAAWLSLQRFRYLLTGGALKKINSREFWSLVEHEKLEYRILQAICGYQPSGQYQGAITLIRTEVAPFDWKTDINQEWVSRSTEGAKLHVVRGNHDNWLYEYMEDLTEVLRNRLENVAPELRA